MKDESENIIIMLDPKSGYDPSELIELSFSKYKTFHRCKKKYNYKYIQKLQSKKKSRPLTTGSWIHECLESYYKTGKWKKGFNKYKKELWDNMFEEEQVEYQDIMNTVEDIMKRYVKQDKIRDKEKIIAVEQDFKIQIPGTPVVLVGKIDLITQNDLGIWVYDHKSAKKVPDEEFRLMDYQLSLYYFIVSTIRKHLGIDKSIPVVGVKFNYIRTKLPNKPELLKKGGLTRRKDLDCDYDTYLEAIIENDLDEDDYQEELSRCKTKRFFETRTLPKSNTMVRNIILEMHSTGDSIFLKNYGMSRNVTKDCAWDCEYKSLCLSELHGHDVSFILETEFELKDANDEDKAEEDI